MEGFRKRSVTPDRHARGKMARKANVDIKLKHRAPMQEGRGIIISSIQALSLMNFFMSLIMKIETKPKLLRLAR